MLPQLTKELWLWCMKKNILLQASSAPTWRSEHSCRRRDQDMVEQVEMDAVSNHIPENQWPANSTVHRLVCEQAIITPPSETRPSGCGHGCLHAELELSSREIVSKPTLGYDRQNLVTHSLTRSSGTSNGSTSLEGPSMVSNAPLNASQSTNSHPQCKQYVRTICQTSFYS